MIRYNVLCATVLAAVMLIPAAKAQPDQRGGCTPHDPLSTANFSSLTFFAAGDLTANGGPSSGLDRARGGEAGLGRAILAQPRERRQDACYTPIRPWTVLIQSNFLYNQSGVERSAIQQAVVTNPENVSLVGAVSGKGKFYSWTLDPTLQVLTTNYGRLYLFGGAGWFRRTIEFTGLPSEGSLIQTSNPSIFGHGGNSVGVDAGFGMDWGRPRQRDMTRLSDLRFYFEVRWVRGLAINQGTTLVPVSAGIRW